MIKYITVCMFFIIISCNFANKREVGSVNNNSNLNKMAKDTLMIYDIEGISAEGAEAKVSYVNGRITNSVTSVYGETGQATIIYEFETDKIKVLETKYSYRLGIENVKSDEDMLLNYEMSYFIDFNGNLIGKEFHDRIDIFKEFKETVPFELK
jgi:hypothetical protein